MIRSRAAKRCRPSGCAGRPRDRFDQFFTPRRIVVEFKPVEVMSCSGHKLYQAIGMEK